jgi:hypothetical protein
MGCDAPAPLECDIHQTSHICKRLAIAILCPFPLMIVKANSYKHDSLNQRSNLVGQVAAPFSQRPSVRQAVTMAGSITFNFVANYSQKDYGE